MKSTDPGSWMARTALSSMQASAHEPVETARTALVMCAAHIMPAAVTNSCLGLAAGEWDRFRKHWNQLATDRYAAELGVRRLRRYGEFSLAAATGQITLMPKASFVQPEASNPLYVGVERAFEPLTRSFVDDPVFQGALRLLGRIATALDGPEFWKVRVHPFRVVGADAAPGRPTPEGLHRDGVTLVSSLLVRRMNAAGGASAIFDPKGRLLLETTLREPGALLLGDDRRTLHSVSPVRPIDRSRPAYRDVLVVTFAPE